MELDNFLLSVGKVPGKQIKYFIIWISNYNAYVKKSGKDSEQDFFDTLSKKHSDWQVVQAHKAVNLYKYYLSSYLNHETEPAHVVSDSWDGVALKIQECCKFQNKSYITEKSYLYWIRTISTYLNYKKPCSVTEQDVKNFLTYPAVQKGLAASTQKEVGCIAWQQRNSL